MGPESIASAAWRSSGVSAHVGTPHHLDKSWKGTVQKISRTHMPADDEGKWAFARFSHHQGYLSGDPHEHPVNTIWELIDKYCTGSKITETLRQHCLQSLRPSLTISLRKPRLDRLPWYRWPKNVKRMNVNQLQPLSIEVVHWRTKAFPEEWLVWRLATR